MVARNSGLVAMALAWLAVAPAFAAQESTAISRITALRVAGMQPVGTFNGVAYQRVFGVAEGLVAANENVVGLARLPKDPQGAYRYTSEFEIIAPAPGQPANEALLIDAENRGGPVMLNLLNEAGVAGPPSRAIHRNGVGNGFLQRHATSYARIQWQTGIARDVPETAQGIGLVIMRDFARVLAGNSARPDGYEPGSHSKLILGGKSQSAWFVNTFVAEGLNVDPVKGTGLFQGALAVDGIGYWMALNRLAEKHNIAPAPYIGANARPLRVDELLSRGDTDPILIDTVAYTDFYRLRASLTSVPVTNAKYRRYEIPAAHAPQSPPVGPGAFAECNSGAMIPLNPISMSPSIRAQFIGIQKAIGVRAAANGPSLPPTTLFALKPAPTTTANFNPLPGASLQVPAVDDNAMPVGGVRFPDVEQPLGKALPVSLAPVTTESIDATCGNRGGFQPFTRSELTAKYGSKERYLARYRETILRLVQQGHLLSEDEAGMLVYAGYLWDNAESYLTRTR